MTTISGSLAITIPNGREATYEEMQAYGQILQDFIREQEVELPLIKDVRRHNQIIDYLQLLADAYNLELAHYKAAEELRQQQMLVAMIRFVGG